MTVTLQKIVMSMMSGFLSALIVDLNAWQKSSGHGFNWKLAFGRWVSGAIAGLLTGLGFTQGQIQ